MSQVPDVCLQSGKSKVRVTPGHGSTVSEVVLDGTTVLYPEYSFEKAGVIKYRGGAPLLFPNAGNLASNSRLTLAQHGFARGSAWQVKSQTKNSLTTLLESSLETEKIFPFKFRLEQQISLTDRAMECVLVVANIGDEEMPVSMGWHHYFTVEGLDQSKVRSFLPEIYQSDTILRYDWPGRIDFDFGGKTVRFTTNSEYKHLVVWSDQPEKYICFEPWEREQTDLSPKSAIMIKPNQSVQYHYCLTLDL